MVLSYFKVAFLMMRTRPMRAALSLLGIYIGVLALVVILSIREGLQRQIESQYKTNGAKVLLVFPGFDPVLKRLGRLSATDLDRVRATPGVLSVQSREVQDWDVRAGSNVRRAKTLGVDEEFVGLYRIPVMRGRNFLPDEIARRSPVCLVTQEFSRTLFPMQDAVGATVDMHGTTFQIIGLLGWDDTIETRTGIREADLFVPPPWIVPQNQNFLMTVEVRIQESFAPAEGVRLLKDALSRGELQRENLYVVHSLDQMAERSRAFMNQILAGLLSIAAISLLVGGIGIANVMVTSVTERTREVGIRKALGARRVDILSQFLVESMTLCGTGGLLAVVTGGLGIQILPHVMALKFIPIFPLWPALGCVGITLGVGLLAGVYPASRAADMPAAEALRYE